MAPLLPALRTARQCLDHCKRRDHATSETGGLAPIHPSGSRKSAKSNPRRSGALRPQPSPAANHSGGQRGVWREYGGRSTKYSGSNCAGVACRTQSRARGSLDLRSEPPHRSGPGVRSRTAAPWRGAAENSVRQCGANYFRRRCWPSPIFFARAERAAA
jgi:hypothetical protein